MPEATNPTDFTTAEAIRKRPQLYVGNGLFGLINYLVYPFVELFSQGVRWVDVVVTETGFEIRSDAVIAIKHRDDGRIIPFEAMEKSGDGYGFECSVLTALSETLVVRTAHSGTLHMLTYRQGERDSYTTCAEAGSFTELSFAPDPSIFKQTSLSPGIFESYLRRMSYLHRGVRFRLAYADQTREYCVPGGLRALFDAVSAPYQLMNTPIHIEASEGRLRLELVFAYHSWTEDWRWCFINNGRAVQGGSHEKGLRDAFGQIHEKLKLRRNPKRGRNGIVALMSVIYPNVVWGGCIKARIGSPELTEIIPRLVTTNVLSWIDDHPESAQELAQMQIFQFPDVWHSYP